MKTINKNQGFTLIELMIAVAIIGILASIAVPSYSGYIKKGKVSAAESDLVAMSVVIENAYMKSLQYPAATAGFADFSATTWQASSDDFAYKVKYVAGGYELKAVGSGTVQGCTVTLNSKGETSKSGCE